VTGLSRRRVLAAAAAGLAAPAAAQGIFARPAAGGTLAFPEPRTPHPDFRSILPDPVRIRSVELWVMPGSDTTLVRVLSEGGAEGVVRASTKVEHTGQFFRDFAVPRFTGTDARDVADTIRKAAREDYEYAGLPYWATLGQVELAIWDLLGKIARRPCAQMIGPVLKRSIPIYMSSNKRDTTPDAEIAHLEQRVAETGARCVKVKIGRRMGYNSDMKAGRSEAMIAGLRKAFGSDMTIYADANGAYDLTKGIEIAAMLEDHGVALFEEPCPFEDFEMTAMLSAAIRQRGYRLKVAGGENDYALERWRWLTANRAFDVMQPDPMYAGGIFRNLAIMEMGRAAGLHYNPHFPRNGADAAPMLHLCAGAPNLWGYQEYRSREDRLDFAHSPVLKPVDGEVAVPLGPGWGIDYDPGIWRTATRA
jgi:L-alanine-DL-glutamate epimerase-like enolase superfamily enzyme